MYMLLMGLCFTFFALTVVAVAFAASSRQHPPQDQPEPQVVKVSVARSASDKVRPLILVSPEVETEVLLRQIESHVRLEQAAAQSFVALPKPAQLHGKASSRFVN